jgi:hypothetical protein
VRPIAVLTWRHGRSKADAVAAIKAALRDAGHDDSVSWSDTAAEARYGPFASVVHVRGEVTDEAVVIEECGGLLGGTVLERLREMLARLFPAGSVSGSEQANPLNEVVGRSKEASETTTGKPTTHSTRLQAVGCGVTLVLLLAASLVAHHLQSPPLTVARQHICEQQDVSPDDLELAGYDRSDPVIFGAVFCQMKVEFRVKGDKSSKKREVELLRYAYFLPWEVHSLKEKSEK